MGKLVAAVLLVMTLVWGLGAARTSSNLGAQAEYQQARADLLAVSAELQKGELFQSARQWTSAVVHYKNAAADALDALPHAAKS